MKQIVNADWVSQKHYLKELAEINGIEFNPDDFPDKTIKVGLFKKRYLQSDAALYMAEQMDRLKKRGATIFFPWKTSPVCVGFNGEKYSRNPWWYIPVVTTPKHINNKDLIQAVSYSEYGGPEEYLNNERRKIGVMLICKECHNEWKHYCGGPGFSGHLFDNQADIKETRANDGIVLLSFCCPVCGSTEIYKRGEFHWD